MNKELTARETMLALGQAARAAAKKLALASSDEKNAALRAMAEEIRADAATSPPRTPRMSRARKPRR